MTIDPNAHPPRVGDSRLEPAAPNPCVGDPRLPEPLQSLADRGPLLLIFLRHFG